MCPQDPIIQILGWTSLEPATRARCQRREQVQTAMLVHMIHNTRRALSNSNTSDKPTCQRQTSETCLPKKQFMAGPASPWHR